MDKAISNTSGIQKGDGQEYTKAQVPASATSWIDGLEATASSLKLLQMLDQLEVLKFQLSQLDSKRDSPSYSSNAQSLPSIPSFANAQKVELEKKGLLRPTQVLVDQILGSLFGSLESDLKVAVQAVLDSDTEKEDLEARLVCRLVQDITQPLVACTEQALKTIMSRVDQFEGRLTKAVESGPDFEAGYGREEWRSLDTDQKHEHVLRFLETKEDLENLKQDDLLKYLKLYGVVYCPGSSVEELKDKLAQHLALT